MVYTCLNLFKYLLHPRSFYACTKGTRVKQIQQKRGWEVSVGSTEWSSSRLLHSLTPKEGSLHEAF